MLKDDNLDFCDTEDSISFRKGILERGHINLVSARLFAPSRYGPDGVRNDDPFLINEVNSWAIRNEFFMVIFNFLLASDYAGTHTNLATMEGANEAARRAVNNIIGVSGLDVKHWRVWPLEDLSWLNWYKWPDKRRYKKGFPGKCINPA